MTIRATRSGLYDSVKATLARNTRRMVDLQEQLATMKRINRPSDDPSGASRAMGLRNDSQDYSRYLSNINLAQSDVELSTSVLQSIGEQVTYVRSLVLQGGNPDLSEASRQAIADDINAALESIVDYSNAMHNGRYVFAGTATTTKPFVTDVAPGGEITQVSYQGNQESIWTNVGANARVKINETGSNVFLDGGPGEDLFSVIASVRDILANDAGVPENQIGDLLTEKLDEVDRVHADVLESMGRLAGRAKSLDLRKEFFEDAEISAINSLSLTEDADVAELVFRLQGEKTQFEILLSSSAALLGPTLMDFLK